MADRLLLDTDLLVDYLRGLPKATAFLEARAEALLVAATTVAELYAGVQLGKERGVLAGFLGAFEIVAIDEDIAQQGGLLRRDYAPAHGTGLADALIAACAQAREARLVTLNAKHFPMLPDAWVPYRKS